MRRTSAGGLSLPRSLRLRRGSDIQALFQRGNRDERASFVALWREGPRGQRVGFAVGRRVGATAVRNRVRRRLREAFRQIQGKLAGDVDVMFIGRAAALGRPFPQLIEEMGRALEAVSARLASGKPGAQKRS